MGKRTSIRRHIPLSVILMIVAAVQQSMGIVSPALSSIGNAFSPVSPTTLASFNTLPSIAGILATFLTGILLDMISHKKLIMVGLSLMTVGGVFGSICNSLFTMFACRSLFGIGLHITNTTIAHCTLTAYTGDASKKQLGLNSIAASSGSIVFSVAGGYLCVLGWRYTFMAHIVFVLPLLLCYFCLIEAKPVSSVRNLDPSKTEKATIPWRTIISWCVPCFLFYVCFFSFVNNMSDIIVNGNIGTSGDTGNVLAVFGIGGMIGSFAYRKWIYKTNMASFYIGIVLFIAAFIIAIAAHSLVALFAASIILGCGFGVFVPTLMYYSGMSVIEEKRSRMVSFINATNCLGGFCSAYLIAGIGTLVGLKIERYYFYIAIGLLTILVVFLFVSLGMNRLRNSDKDTKEKSV